MLRIGCFVAVVVAVGALVGGCPLGLTPSPLDGTWNLQIGEAASSGLQMTIAYGRPQTLRVTAAQTIDVAFNTDLPLSIIQEWGVVPAEVPPQLIQLGGLVKARLNGSITLSGSAFHMEWVLALVNPFPVFGLPAQFEFARLTFEGTAGESEITGQLTATAPLPIGGLEGGAPVAFTLTR